MGGGVLYQAFIYLAAAVVMVPIAKKLGLGSVLGYLLAGVAIGPFGLHLLGSEGQDVMHFAEFGVVMMLFIVGLELRPALLWRLRAPILGLGGLQVLLTTVVLAGAAAAFGLPSKMAVAIGLTLSMSSTAIVLQTLNEKQLLKSDGGQSAFAVLLFQDIAVIPILAVFPLLATAGHAAGDSHAAATLLDGLPSWAQPLAVLAAVVLVVGGSRFLVRPIFRAIAQTRLREIFVAAALLLIIGIALLMGQVGLSPALGTFLAGVVLADSEYRHELESDIDPFKGLLLGLFFLAVGATIDFGLIVSRPLLIAGLVAGIVIAKFAVLWGLGRAFGLSRDQGSLLAFSLPQVGEFAFVLFSYGIPLGVFTAAVASPLVAAVALSMAITPLLIVLNERVVQPRLCAREPKDERKADTIDEHAAVLIAGFGSFGSTVGRLLRANGVATTVLDLDADRVELLRRLGLKVYYGDASRYDLLLAAGAEKARLLVIALDSAEKTLQLVHTVKTHFPQITIMARAFDWEDAHDLTEAGVGHVYSQSLDTSLRVGVDALHYLGFRAYHSHRSARQFLRHDLESLRELTADRKVSQARYLTAARKRIEDLERLLEADRADRGADADMGWDAETLREDVRGMTR